MSDPGTGFITCQCGTGKVEEDGVSRNCPVCDGDPRITLETIKEYARQVDSFSKENAELRSAYQRSRVHSCRLEKRIEELERELGVAKDEATEQAMQRYRLCEQLQAARELAELIQRDDWTPWAKREL